VEGKPLNSPKRVLVTDDSGFVGCNFLRMMVPERPDDWYTENPEWTWKVTVGPSN
jgi:dTDP-D-glucose 4,6-dehydratase